MTNVTAISYLPPERRERSKLQQVKDMHRSYTQTNKKGIPKDLNKLKSIKYRQHAIAFLNQYTDLSKKTSKTQYCKNNHISHNSLNIGLQQLGHKSRVNETDRDRLRPIETDPDQSESVDKVADKTVNKVVRKRKSKNTSEIKAGKNYDYEEINEMINNGLANLNTF